MNCLLIATDLAESSERVVVAGLGLARKLNLPVELFTVVDQATVFSEPSTGMVLTEAFDDIYQQSVRDLDQLKTSNPDIEISVRCETGNFKEILVEEVNNQPICMVVIGSHSPTLNGHLPNGSKAAYIMGHLAVPMLIIPLNQQNKR
jgi:nucleotide-binding universal stress UspA family protein